MMMRHIVIPVFIPHKGCPFDCIYCNQKSISGEIHRMTEERMREIIEEHLASIKEKAYVEIGFYGGSFTGIDPEEQIRFLQTANEYLGEKGVQSIRLSTRPDYINREILSYLKKYHVKTIELGAQSLDSMVLTRSCRGHRAEDVENAAALIRESGIGLGIQTMIGLPEDTREKALETAYRIVAMKPEIVRIYPTLVIKGTYLEKMYRNGKYISLKLEEAVDICAELMDIYEGHGIQVIRVGLQPTDTIHEGMDVVAGPFHPAFRQLVESKRMLNRLCEEIEHGRRACLKEINIFAAPSNLSNVIGQKRENVNKLKQRYDYKTIRVIEDKSLTGKQIRIEGL